MKKVVSAQSMIERDAMIARLKSEGIEVVTPPRDMSRKVTENTTDLALDGYSMFFDGFDILVDDEDEVRARQLLADFAKEHQAPAPSTEPSPHWQRFYYSSIFSLLFPVLLNVAALYHLVKAVQKGEQPRIGYLIFSLFCFCTSCTVAAVMLWTYL